MSAGSAVIFRTKRAKQLFDLSRFSLKEKFPPAKLYPGYILADNPTAGISKKCAERGAGQVEAIARGVIRADWRKRIFTKAAAPIHPAGKGDGRSACIK